MAASKKVALRLKEVLGVPFVGVQVIGVDVPHAHVHLIPFSTVSEYRNQPDMEANANAKKLAQLAERLYFH
jgi:diadenosine tetraphosphate (Ap4A) HIT family hydrolase